MMCEHDENLENTSLGGNCSSAASGDQKQKNEMEQPHQSPVVLN